MQKLIFKSLIFFNFFCPFLSRPLIDSSELPFPDSKMNFGDLNDSDQRNFLQNLPALLGNRNRPGDIDDIFIKEGLSPENYNLEDSIKEVFLGKHPRISLLSGLQSKDRKQHKKRGGNLSECFWKYCV